MSDDETVELIMNNKRKVESDGEEEEVEQEYKRGRFSPTDEVPLQSEINHSKKNIEEAIKALDRIQYEVNMGNVLVDSPEASDHDTPPESEDDESSPDEMLNQAHALGFAACIRETFRFLDCLGISENDPIYEQLKSRFVGATN
jgi:hypothetical protein